LFEGTKVTGALALTMLRLFRSKKRSGGHGATGAGEPRKRGNHYGPRSLLYIVKERRIFVPQMELPGEDAGKPVGGNPRGMLVQQRKKLQIPEMPKHIFQSESEEDFHLKS